MPHWDAAFLDWFDATREGRMDGPLRVLRRRKVDDPAGRRRRGSLDALEPGDPGLGVAVAPGSPGPLQAHSVAAITFARNWTMPVSEPPTRIMSFISVLNASGYGKPITAVSMASTLAPGATINPLGLP